MRGARQLVVRVVGMLPVCLWGWGAGAFAGELHPAGFAGRMPIRFGGAAGYDPAASDANPHMTGSCAGAFLAAVSGIALPTVSNPPPVDVVDGAAMGIQEDGELRAKDW
jgi:hypothetical protein